MEPPVTWWEIVAVVGGSLTCLFFTLLAISLW